MLDAAPPDPALVQAAFRAHVGKEPTVVAYAPGRVNLIGDHTDYNDGLALPMTIHRGLYTAVRPRSDRIVRVRAEQQATERVHQLGAAVSPTHPLWARYVLGMAHELWEAGLLTQGADLYLTGTVPMGAGLSSSAALTTSVGRALLASVGQGQDPGALAQRAQRVEHVYAGVQCGLMDPLVIGLGRAGHALQIDFRALTSTPVTLPLDQATVVVVNSGVERRLAGSAYNERRATCEAVVAHLAATGMRGPSGAVLASLRDVTEAHLEAHRADLGEARFRRARHVVRENERVEAAAEAFQNGRLGEVGRWMTASHKSLRDDYAVSGPELDLLVELALDHGAWGARLTGAGFGGCTVQLVPPDAVDAFAEDVAAAYQQATGRRAQVLAIRTNHETQTWRVALGA